MLRVFSTRLGLFDKYHFLITCFISVYSLRVVLYCTYTTKKMTFKKGEMNITLKDGIQYAVYLVSFVFFISSISAKIDELARIQKEMKEDQKEAGNDTKLFMQNIQNQTNSNSLQINLLQKDVQQLKDERYYGQKKQNN